MPPRIDDERRAEIIAAIQAGTKSARQIAKDHGVSASTVSKIAADEHLDGAFERAQTKKATEASATDSKARRAAIASRMLDIADDLLDQIYKPHLVFNIGGKDNVFTGHTLPAPPTGDIRNLMTSAAVALDKHLLLDRHDSDTHGLSDVDAWLDHLTGD